MLSVSKFLRITFQIFAGIIVLLALIKQAEGLTGEIYLDLTWGERLTWFTTHEPTTSSSGVLPTMLGEKRYQRIIANASPMVHRDPGAPTLMSTEQTASANAPALLPVHSKADNPIQ